VRVLWIENEGPRGKFREKIARKLDAWDGPDLEDRLHVLTEPWARFSFADPGMRRELVALLADCAIEVVVAGPISRLGVVGGGTPEQIQAFVDMLECVRADLDRALAFELINHENKQGNVSGAWEGATDTLAHVQGRGNGHTAIVWRKARWAPDIHGRTWKLDWLPGERYELDDTPDTTEEDVRESLIALVTADPGKSWNGYEEQLSGKAQRKRSVRDELLRSGDLVNTGTEKRMRLYLPGQSLPDQATLDEVAA
jgi:hypothetical protein